MKEIQPVELEKVSEVESITISESNIDPFETMYGEMDEESFHRMMEGNDWTYSPLFSDKDFQNEDWHKYTCTETCAAIGNTRHGCESLGTDIQSIREIDDSGCTLISEIDTMMTNMTGSSILKSTGHTNWVKPVNLSVRFILGDGEQDGDNHSDSESDIIESDSEDDWESCLSSVEEDECFYDAVSLDEEANLTQKSQVPELKELNLVEGKRKLQNEGDYQTDNHIKVLSNMMEEETHVVDDMSDHEGICQVLVEAIEDQSEVCGRAIEAISGLSQSNQCRLGKSDGKPNTPLPATKSVGQKQKVGSGNLSLSSPDVVTSDLFHDLYCGSKSVSMDETGFWSILTDTLHYVKPEVDSSMTYSYDQRRHQNAKSRYFDAAFSNVPNEENILIDQTANSKKEDFDAANYNVPNVPIYTQGLFPKYEEDRYGNLTLFTTSVFKPHESICATYLWTDENQCSIMESEAYDMEGNDMWFKQGKFPINLQSETQGELMDGTNIKVTTLMDTDCSKPILNRKVYDKHPYLQKMPHYPIQSIGVIVADDGVIKVTEATQFMIKFHGHAFEFIAYLADMSETFDFVIGQKIMYELEATVDYNNLVFTFLKRSLPVYAVDNFTVKPGKTKDVALELKEVPFKVHG